MSFLRFYAVLAVFLFASASLPLIGQAQAQGGVDAVQADFENRLVLAEKMHKIRSAREQVATAIERVAQSQPPEKRAGFISGMENALNYKAIERMSIDAMAETYTAAELEAMIEYYSKPEAISASAKTEEYSAKVYPEIIRMLDRAMMRMRTGE